MTTQTTAQDSIVKCFVSDTRRVEIDLRDVPLFYTPAGARPIAPKWMRLSYHLDTATGEVCWVYYEIGGQPAGNWARRRRYPEGFLTRRGEYERAAAPDWIRYIVEACAPAPRTDSHVELLNDGDSATELVQRRYDQGWSDLTVRTADGTEVGGITFDDTGKRTWWADDTIGSVR